MAGFYVIAHVRPSDGEEPGILNWKPHRWQNKALAQIEFNECVADADGFPYEIIGELRAIQEGYVTEERNISEGGSSLADLKQNSF